MKKKELKPLFFAAIVLIFCAYACKGEKEDKSLHDRFANYLNAISEMNIDSVQHYIYPGPLTHEQVRKSMETSYGFIKKGIQLDSVSIDTIFPIFHVDKGSYAKASFLITMLMPMDSSEISANNGSVKNSITHSDEKGLTHSIGQTLPAPRITLLAALMSGKYGMDFFSLEEKDGMRIMRARGWAIAAKDEFAKDWSFFNVTSDQEVINKLFSQNVLKKLVSNN